MWELDYKESWEPENWCFSTMVLEKTLESPLDCKDIKPFNPKGNQSWIFIGRTDAEAETPVLGHLMQRTDSFEKTLMLGKTAGGRRREWQDEMVGWHHQLNGHEFELALVVGDGQGNLACCSPWGRKESDRTEWLNWTELVVQLVKNLPAIQETWVQPLGQEDSLEKEMATHSSILAWKIPWMEEPG